MHNWKMHIYGRAGIFSVASSSNPLANEQPFQPQEQDSMNPQCQNLSTLGSVGQE